MVRRDNTQMRNLLDELLAKTREGTICWQAVGLHRVHAQYEGCIAEIGVNYRYSRRPSIRSPGSYQLSLGRPGSVRQTENGERFVQSDLGLLYIMCDYTRMVPGEFDATLKIERLYKSACEQDSRAENLRHWVRTEWGCLNGCLLPLSLPVVGTALMFVATPTLRLW